MILRTRRAILDQTLILRKCFLQVLNIKLTCNLKKVWNKINLLVAGDTIKSKFFTPVYYPDQSKKIKPKLFVGHLLKRFLRDENGPAESMELDCLSVTLGSPAVLEEPPKHLGCTIGVFLAYN